MALKDEKEGSEAPHSEEDVEAGGQDHPEDNQRMGSGTQMLLQNLNKVGNILGILPAGHEKPVEEKEQAREEAAQEPSEPLASHPARVSLPQEEEFSFRKSRKAGASGAGRKRRQSGAFVGSLPKALSQDTGF